MKAFIALVCLIAVAMAQETSTPRPATTTSRPTTTTSRPTTTTSRPTTTTSRPPPTTRPTSTARPPSTLPPTTTLSPVDCDVSVGEDDWAILLPNPESCQSYYACEAGEPILMICPEGLDFNPVLLVCDWPDQANCTVSQREDDLLRIGA